MIPFFFPNFDWNFFLVSSCSSMFISLRSDISVGESVSVQKGFSLSWSDSSCLWSDSVVADSVGVIVSFNFNFSGPCSFRCSYVVTGVINLTTCSWHPLLLCLCAQAGDHWEVSGSSKLNPSLPPFFPWAFWPTRGLDMWLSPKDAFLFAGVVHHSKFILESLSWWARP